MIGTRSGVVRTPSALSNCRNQFDKVSAAGYVLARANRKEIPVTNASTTATAFPNQAGVGGPSVTTVSVRGCTLSGMKPLFYANRKVDAASATS